MHRLPLRRVRLLTKSAEQFVAAVSEINAALEEVVTAAGERGPSMSDRTPEVPPLREAVALVVRDAVEEAGGSANVVDVRVSSLPEDWIRIGLEDAGTGTDGIDFFRLLDATKRALADLGLAVAGEMVTARAGRLLARAGPLRRATWDVDSPFRGRFPWSGGG